MRLNQNRNNNIASYGYATEYPFMTVHTNKTVMFLIDDLPGEVLQYNPNQPGGNRVKRIDQDPADPYIALSVYRSDLPSGRTHAVTGTYSNVFIPVNYTTTQIVEKEYTFIFNEEYKMSDHYYLIMIRTKEINNISDIINYENLLSRLTNGDEMKDYSSKEFSIRDKKVTIFVKGESHFQMSPLSNTGKKIISCLCAWIKKSIEHGLSLVDSMDYTRIRGISAKWKILKIENDGWYRWTYCNNSIIITERYNPKYINEKNEFIESEVQKNGDIIATLFSENNRSKDVKIPSRTVRSSNFDLVNEVCRLAPNSLFRIEHEREGKVWH